MKKYYLQIFVLILLSISSRGQIGYTLLDSCHVITPFVEGYNRTYLNISGNGFYEISDNKNIADINWTQTAINSVPLYNMYSEYDSSGNVIVNYFMQRDSVRWNYTTRTIFAYDSLGRMNDSLQQHYVSNAWVNSTEWRWDYNSSGNILILISRHWNNGQWENQTKQERFYDSFLNDTLAIFYNGNVNQWDTFYYVRKVFNTFGNIIIQQNLLYSSASSIYNHQTFYTYDNYNRIIFQVDQIKDTIGWINDTRDSVYYDSTGNVNHTIFSWDGALWNCEHFDNIHNYSPLFYNEISGTTGPGCIIDMINSDESFQYDSSEHLIYHRVFDVLNLSTNIYWYYYDISGHLFGETDSTILHGGDIIISNCTHQVPLLFSPENQFYYLCPGDSFRIINHASGGNYDYHYSWKFNDILLSDSVPELVKTAGNKSGWYSMTLTDGNNNYYTESVYIQIHPEFNLGNDTIVCHNATLTLSPGNYSSYLWQDGSTTGIYSAFSAITDTILYWVQVSDSTGCTNRDSLTIIFDVCQLVPVGNKSNFNIFPNPSTGHLTINLPEQSPYTEVTITNAFGQELSRARYINTSKLNLEIHGESGLYFVRVVAGEKIGVYKVMKM